MSCFRLFAVFKPDDFAKNQYKTEIKKRCFSDTVGEAPFFYSCHGTKRILNGKGAPDNKLRIYRTFKGCTALFILIHISISLLHNGIHGNGFPPKFCMNGLHIYHCKNAGIKS